MDKLLSHSTSILHRQLAVSQVHVNSIARVESSLEIALHHWDNETGVKLPVDRHVLVALVVELQTKSNKDLLML